MKCFQLFLFLLSFTWGNIYAQTSKTAAPVKQCNALYAQQLVEQQATESKSNTDTDKRINILIKVADFLWIMDEESARGYFAEAFQFAREKSREKEPEKSTGTPFLAAQKQNYPFQVIRAVAKRDAEWSKKLTEIAFKDAEDLKEELKKEENHKPNPYEDEGNVGETMSLAISLAEQNPAAALYFLRRTMRFPLHRNWYFNLYAIATKNPQLAEQIYPELLNNYPNADVSRLLYFSAYPFANERIFGAEKFQLGTSVPKNLAPNVNFQRQFLIVFLRRVNSLTVETANMKTTSNLPESAFAYMALNELEPIIMQQFPELKELFLQAKTTITTLTSPETLENIKKREDSQKSVGRTFAERIKDLEKADEEGKLKDVEIVNLVTSAKKEEEFEMTETWLDKIKEEKVREDATNYFYFSRSKLATKEKRYEDARKFAGKVPKIEHRAVLYFDVAEAKLKEPATKLDSLESLSEVYKMAQKAPDSVEKAQVLLGLAYMYEKVDHFNALDAVSNSIKTANKLENPNLFSSFMMHRIVGKDFGSFIGYSVPGFDISQTFGELSKNDFQGAVTQAESFTDKYLRTLAVLAAVDGCAKTVKKDKPKTVK